MTRDPIAGLGRGWRVEDGQVQRHETETLKAGWEGEPLAADLAAKLLAFAESHPGASVDVTRPLYNDDSPDIEVSGWRTVSTVELDKERAIARVELRRRAEEIERSRSTWEANQGRELAVIEAKMKELLDLEE